MNNRQKLVQKQFLHNEQAVIKRLDQVYNKGLSDVEEKIKNLTFRIGKLQQQYDWMDDTDPEKAKVKSMIQSKIYQKQYQEQLKAQLDDILNKMQDKQFLTVSDYLDECYSDGFIGAIYDQHGQGVPIVSPINQESMVRAVQLDSKISKGLYTKLGEDVGLLKQKITAQVSRSIATGMTYSQTAKQLAGYTKIGYNKAIRIARTEGHRIQCTATMDAMTAAKDRGADVVKQWDATLDAKTRESHSQVDMEIRELKEPFSNGLMFPGDPSGSAAEVVNCRCALNQRAKWALEGSFTKMNNFTKQIETFESPEEYGEFKKAFFSKENRDFMNYVEQMQDKYKTRDWEKILKKMNDREYKQYSKLLASDPIYNKNPKKVDVSDISKVIDPYSFTDDQSEAIQWYVSGEGQFINQFFRGRVDSDFGELSDMEKQLADLLDDATNRVLPDDINALYRSVDASAVFGDLDWMDWENLEGGLLYNDKQSLKKAQVLIDQTKGKTITEKGFMSTSKNYDVVAEWGSFTGAEKPIVIEFEDIPNNVKGADLKQFDVEGDEQYEVLLARNTKYQITDIFAKDGSIHVKAKILAK